MKTDSASLLGPKRTCRTVCDLVGTRRIENSADRTPDHPRAGSSILTMPAKCPANACGTSTTFRVLRTRNKPYADNEMPTLTTVFYLMNIAPPGGRKLQVGPPNPKVRGRRGVQQALSRPAARVYDLPAKCTDRRPRLRTPADRRKRFGGLFRLRQDRGGWAE